VLVPVPLMHVGGVGVIVDTGVMAMGTTVFFGAHQTAVRVIVTVAMAMGMLMFERLVSGAD